MDTGQFSESMRREERESSMESESDDERDGWMLEGRRRKHVKRKHRDEHRVGHLCFYSNKNNLSFKCLLI